MDFPKTMYRGRFASKAQLEAAWNNQNGIEQRHVMNVQEQGRSEGEGFVESPLDMVKMPLSASAAPPSTVKQDEPLSSGPDEPVITPRSALPKGRPLSGDR